jgi:hypothetical protein
MRTIEEAGVSQAWARLIGNQPILAGDMHTNYPSKIEQFRSAPGTKAHCWFADELTGERILSGRILQIL